MAIKCNTGVIMNAVSTAAVKKLRKTIMQRYKRLGMECISREREAHDYQNRTGMLETSTGFVIYDHNAGRIVSKMFDGANIDVERGGDEEEAINAALELALSAIEEGDTDTWGEMATVTSTVSPHRGISTADLPRLTMHIVAGMWYATNLERGIKRRRRYDVIDTARNYMQNVSNARSKVKILDVVTRDITSI